MTRKEIPKRTREVVFGEYNHRCAICGADKPQIHHIDEDHSNNEIDNLLPLCPNCHLTDQHNPTKKIDPQKLQLFRKYKDPAILKPQFDPIFVRQSFLSSVEEGEESIGELEQKAKELVDFIADFEMGGFYSKKLSELLSVESWPAILIPRDRRSELLWEESRKKNNIGYREKLIDNKSEIQGLLIELLRFQSSGK